MAIRRRNVFLALFFAAIVFAVVAEFVRDRPAETTPVVSPRPEHANETARLEGGFSWSTTRGGRALFDLLAGKLLGLEGGIHLLEEIEDFRIYLDDGRPVLVSARRGRLSQGQGREQAVRLALLDNVVVTDPDGLRLETEELVYDSADRELSSPSPAHIVAPDGLEADLGSFTYRPDARVIEARDQIRLKLSRGEPWEVLSARADYRLATGELVFSRPFRASQGRRSLLAASAVVRLGQGPGTASLRGDGPVVLDGRDAGGRWQLAGAEIDLAWPATAAPSGRAFTIGGPAGLLYSATNGSRVRLRSERVSFSPSAGGTPGRIEAGPGFFVHAGEGGKEGGRSGTLEGQWLRADRDPGGSITRLRGEGSLRYSGDDGSALEADLLSWRAERPDIVEIVGAPARAWQGDDVVEAPKLTLERARRVLVGEGGALTEIASMSGSGNGLFDGAEPVRVRCERVELPQGKGQIRFEGSVQAWQEERSIRSQQMRLDQREQTLHAEGSVLVRLSDLERKTAEGEMVKRTVRVRGDRLDYAAATRLAVIVGNAVYDEPGGQRIAAERMEIQRAAESGVERLQATGSVTLEAGPARGRGDELSWTGGEGGTVVLAGKESLAQLERKGKGIVRAARIRYDLATGDVSTEGSRATVEQQAGGTSPPEKR